MALHLSRIEAIRNSLRAEGLDGIIITRPEHRRYSSGFSADSEEDGLLLVTRSSQWIVTDFRYIDQVAEEAPAYTLYLRKGSLISSTASLITEQSISKVAFETDHCTFSWFNEIREALPQSVELHPAKNFFVDMRLTKDSDEIAAIRKAAEIADIAFNEILNYIKPGITELEIAARLEASMRSLGSTKPSFQTIVASGKRGAMPHGTASSKPVLSGELVTMDFGAVYNGYHSDMTRTIGVGEVGVKEREIYNIVLEAQVAGLNSVAPGKTGCDIDGVARDIITAAGYGDRFGHGLGHGVGLEIHEAPRLSARATDILRPGMVVTVEPGIYISGFGGVRIEDLVVVTETGFDLLSHSSKELLILQ